MSSSRNAESSEKVNESAPDASSDSPSTTSSITIAEELKSFNEIIVQGLKYDLVASYADFKFYGHIGPRNLHHDRKLFALSPCCLAPENILLNVFHKVTVHGTQYVFVAAIYSRNIENGSESTSALLFEEIDLVGTDPDDITQQKVDGPDLKVFELDEVIKALNSEHDRDYFRPAEGNDSKWPQIAIIQKLPGLCQRRGCKAASERDQCLCCASSSRGG